MRTLPLAVALTLPLLVVSSLSRESSASPAAKEPGVDEIVRRTNEAAYYQGQDGRARVTMTIVDRTGNKRTRQFTILRKNKSEPSGDQSFYVYFHKPADVSKMVFIAQKHVVGADDRWLYLPGLDLVKRIAASDGRTSFVGSDWYYEDVSGRPVTADKHVLLETSKRYYVIENKPKNPDGVEFSSFKMWIHRGTYLPTRVEYFDKRGKKYRVMTVEAVSDVQGFKTVTKATMESLNAGTRTTVEYDQVRYNLDLPDKLFTERYLRRAPLTYLQGR